MSDTPNWPIDDPNLTLSDELALARAARIRRQAQRSARDERRRRADNDGRPDRVAELVADINVAVQRARWSLEVEQAQRVTELLEGDTDDLGLSDGVWVSGDHRPTEYDLAPRAPFYGGSDDDGM